MRRFLIPVLTAALLLPACSDGGGPDASENPKAALTSAFENLTSSDGQTMVMTLLSDEGSLTALGEGDFTPENASLILESSVTVSSTNPEDPKDAEFEMVIDVDGDLIEAKQVDQVVYIRVDGRDFIERFGTEAEIEAGLAEMPPQFSFLNTLVDGEWLALTGMEAMQQQLGVPSPDAATQKKLLADITKAIEDNAEVRSEGSDDVGDHLVATLPIRPLYESLSDTFASLAMTGVPGAQLPPASEIPDEEVDLHLWVEDDSITQIELDLMQFGDWEGAEPTPEGVTELGVRITLEEFGGGVEAPDAAEEVDLMQLMQTFFQGAMGGMSSGSETAPAPGEGQSSIDDLCKSLEGAPPEVVEQFAAECPELQP